MSLQNKTALVTGGATGIGLGIARSLAAAGCRVAIAGRREDKLREAAAAWAGKPAFLVHTVDVANRDDVKKLVTWAEKELGQIDILVNSAGVNIKQRTMADMPPEEWDRVLAINATGVYNCIWAALPAMRARGDGLIVNISSVSGKRAGDLGGIAYNASKFACTGLGTSVGLEERKHGIRVTNVYPGEVDTPILEQRPNPVTDAHRATMLLPEDVGVMVAAIAQLPPRAHVPEIIIKPASAYYA